MRILVVDDSEDWRDLTEAALMSAGYEAVTTAESATDAYGKLGLSVRGRAEASAVDLVVLDLFMPEIDGIEACAQIRNDQRYADVPIIMVTAANDMDSLSNAFVAGATDYITKPFNRVELLARVRSALKIKAELDRRKARESELIALSRGTWGDRDATRFVDDDTGLFHGAAAEAYLATAAELERGNVVSVFALSIDRLRAYAAARGHNARRDVLIRVAQALGRVAAPIGLVPSIYPDGVIVLVAPRMAPVAAKALGQALRSTVASLDIRNPEAIVSDRITASVGVVSAYQARTELIVDARRMAEEAAAAGGNRVASVDLLSN